MFKNALDNFKIVQKCAKFKIKRNVFKFMFVLKFAVLSRHLK